MRRAEADAALMRYGLEWHYPDGVWGRMDKGSVFVPGSRRLSIVPLGELTDRIEIEFEDEIVKTVRLVVHQDWS